MNSSAAATAALPVHELRNRAGERPTFRGEFRSLVEYSHLVSSLVYRDLTVRYKRSVLGFLWTMLNPLLLMVIFVVVFSSLFRFALPHYETYFLSAFLPWTFFAQTTTSAMASLSWNGALMKRVRVPKTIFAVTSTMSGLINLGLSIVPLLLIMLFSRAPITAAMLFLPVSFLILGVMTLGVALGLSALSVFFTDVREMYGVAIQALMYLTPIMYPISIVPLKYRGLVMANPMMYMMELFRSPIYYGELPSLEALVITSLVALLALLVGWRIFRRFANDFYAHL
jgi:ABC-type polysaccharide/polyol phosphate export permease